MAPLSDSMISNPSSTRRVVRNPRAPRESEKSRPIGPVVPQYRYQLSTSRACPPSRYTPPIDAGMPVSTRRPWVFLMHPRLMPGAPGNPKIGT